MDPKPRDSQEAREASMRRYANSPKSIQEWVSMRPQRERNNASLLNSKVVALYFRIELKRALSEGDYSVSSAGI
jgi:hypothetical protein